METNPKTLVITPVYNEKKLELFLDKLNELKKELNFELLVVNDGSTDDTQQILDQYKCNSIVHSQNSGVGKSLIDGMNYAIENDFEYCIVIASNGKDNPLQIPRLLNPLYGDTTDFVQGSRYMKDGEFQGTPFFRKVATKCFTFFWNLLTGFYLRDASNGFRAFNVKIFKDERININQEWLYKYELEYYLLFKIFKYKYRVKEIPVSKNYPRKKNYSKISGLRDWWSIARPIIFLKLGLKK
jgi:dolichol-phosphate mannosyltransferase